MKVSFAGFYNEVECWDFSSADIKKRMVFADQVTHDGEREIEREKFNKKKYKKETSNELVTQSKEKSLRTFCNRLTYYKGLINSQLL